MDKILNPHPQTPSPREGAVYRGLPPLRPCLGLRPKPHFIFTKRFIDSLTAEILCGSLFFVFYSFLTLILAAASSIII